MRTDLKKKILAVAVLPVLLLGMVTIIISLTRVKGALIDEIQESLKGTAAATLAAYDQNSGEYLMTENGNVWKGNYNISKSESMVDNIKEKTGMDVTFFYGDTRIMTSAKDAGGERILGSPAGDVVVERVLNNGEEYFSKSVSLDGTMNYGYYIPVYQKGDSTSPIGMIFVGTDKEVKDAAIDKIIWIIVAAVAVVMAVCIVIAAVLSISITSSLKESIGVVQSVAMGELGIRIDKKLIGRKDEIGDLSRAISALQKELREILKKITADTDKLMAAAEGLGVTARETNRTMKAVEKAVNVITESATEQAESTRNASENMAAMGNQISVTADEVGCLNKNADVMRCSSEQAAVTIKQLREINEEVQRSIEAIAVQTNQTNESAQKIREATGIISSIAEETNLLSLNASIEAARAGENGRGFAVVAAQIQKLAEQSNESSRTIEDITNTLIGDSAVAVTTMQRVKEIVDSQSQNMVDTERIVAEVTGGINTSLNSIEQIRNTTFCLEDSRNEIVKTVEDLSEIAQQNASSTQETRMQTVEVADTFERIEKSALSLKEIAGEMSDTMKHFHL